MAPPLAARVPVLALLAAVAAAALAATAPLAAAQPWAVCDGKGGNYSAGSTYASNLLRLVSVLRTNASNSPALFASGSAGAGADVVYGLVLCRGDLSASDCFDCGTRAGEDVQRVCNRTRDAALVYNQCYVRVAGADFLASTNNTGMVPLISGTSIPSGVDAVAYVGAVARLLNATARYAVENSVPSSPRLYFATGQLVGLDPRVPNIWSMAQCEGDLSPEQCLRCLHDLVMLWWNGSGFETNGEGARLAGSRCNLRSELGDKFYTGAPMVKLQMNGDAAVPPTPAPSTVPVPGTTGGKTNSAGNLLGIILPIVFVAVVAATTLYVWNVRKKRRSRGTKLHRQTHTAEDFESIKSTLLSLASLQVATNNFDESNKLGQGGFGAVYKGDLSGQEVAVKRLSKGSGQGLEELRNELVLVAKLHHKNLVRLEGFCLEEGEKLLVYEYMPNKSLDTILFDPEEKRRLDWRKRFNIIEGVARGLQYLHEDSQKKIVHRDMKASNVLLDADMNPKIGDFGLARLFGQDQTRDVTNRIVGTFGYMSPEYVMRGQYSTKSDVFSFGILVIEIVTGQRNTGQYFYDQNEDIISIVWRHWSEGTIAEMVDDSLGRNYSEAEVLKCVNIGLLCLQQNPMDRPAMSDVVVMLDGDATSSLPPAARPTFFLDRSSDYSYATGTVSYPSAR
ncbi:cysteine-rich receptor-like protein kinase 15 [Panicum miliaceum]|uniref:Cysteine-rich receptor-like protein kinase 15 n=1 Tax=Panicum miliaceum TaxID=4540 RepID=A0A3L6TBA7_PANMI|nr:cysteine-rich receptor-like protein kinase 15 [Panicum miliaceum]